VSLRIGELSPSNNYHLLRLVFFSESTVVEAKFSQQLPPIDAGLLCESKGLAGLLSES
jgi:hypothetical protein